MANKKNNYSKRTTKSLKTTLRKDILESMESSSALRNTIRQVFQKANRRIQNVKTSGAYSPAVDALGDRGDAFSKFSMSGKSWTELKMEYGKAVAFLQQPTSTATGAREYNNAIKERYNLSTNEFNALVSDYMGKLSSLSGTAFVGKYLKSYKDFSGEFEQEAASASDQMESDAVSLSEALQDSVEQAADDVSGIFDALGELGGTLEIPF